jgi:1-pyrroline-5-carboxylate dehydrogenase
MPNAFFKIPEIKNESVKSYAPGSPERKALKQKLAELNRGGLDIR